MNFDTAPFCPAVARSKAKGRRRVVPFKIGLPRRSSHMGARSGGERGIRTLDTPCGRIRAFQARSFSHSDISPSDISRKSGWDFRSTEREKRGFPFPHGSMTFFRSLIRAPRMGRFEDRLSCRYLASTSSLILVGTPGRLEHVSA